MKIEVTNAVIDGKKHGEQLTVSDKSAQHLISIGYAKKVTEAPKPKVEEEAPKPQTRKRNTRKKTNDDK
jgi:hypothetical protein